MMVVMPCANCGSAVRGEVEPTYCEPCQRAIALVVDVLASRIVASTLRGLADEVEASAPGVILDEVDLTEATG